ncbi:hypothetical protein NKG94_27265 [Micromonospora sp. M12]
MSAGDGARRADAGLRPDWQSTTVDDLYFAGTIAQARDVKHASSPFIDGFRYNLRTFVTLLRERYDDVPLAYDEVTRDAEALTTLVLDRVNWSSALWTQFEYLCDAYVLDETSGRFRHYVDLPEDYAVERFRDERHYYTVTLRWGVRTTATCSPSSGTLAGPGPGERLHPPGDPAVPGAELVAEQHLLEDLLAEWRRPTGMSPAA